MYVDLSTSLSYNRRNEPKLVFDDASKADTKTLPKVPQSTLTSIPKASAQEERPQPKETNSTSGRAGSSAKASQETEV